MNKKLFPMLSVGQAILLLVAANLVATGFLISLLIYSRDVGQATQKDILQLLYYQGNFSTKTRAQLINEFSYAADRGGFATHQDIAEVNASLVRMLGETVAHEEKLLAIQPFLGTNNTVTKTSNNPPTSGIYFLTDAFFDDEGWGTQGFNGVLPLNASSNDGIPISKILPSLEKYADKNPRMIITQGFQWADPVLEVAKTHPSTKFVVMTGLVNASNVQSIYPQQQQGSFLLGALAAMISKSHVVGFVGGQEYPNIINIEEGFKSGARYIDPNIKVLTEYTFDFNNVTKGRLIALGEINQGADVILHTADTSGQGVINAAQKKGVYALGAVADQSRIAPDTVLSSFVIDMNKAYGQAYKQVINNKFVGNITRPGMETGPNGPGTGIIYLAPFHSLDSKVPDEVKTRLAQLTHDVMTGKIKVPERNIPIS